MAWKRKVTGSVLTAIGFLLSPLSWWNDLFVNLPLALLFAWAVAAVHKPAFSIALVVGYLLTNVLGFFLMHKGIRQLLAEKDKPETKRELRKDFLVSVLYTALIVVLVKAGVLKPLEQYFR